jgi:hypothetical protein
VKSELYRRGMQRATSEQDKDRIYEQIKQNFLYKEKVPSEMDAPRNVLAE